MKTGSMHLIYMTDSSFYFIFIRIATNHTILITIKSSLNCSCASNYREINSDCSLSIRFYKAMSDDYLSFFPFDNTNTAQSVYILNQLRLHNHDRVNESILPHLENQISSLHPFLNGCAPSLIDLERYRILGQTYDDYSQCTPTHNLEDTISLLQVLFNHVFIIEI